MPAFVPWFICRIVLGCLQLEFAALRNLGSMPQSTPIAGGSHLVTLPHNGFYPR